MQLRILNKTFFCVMNNSKGLKLKFYNGDGIQVLVICIKKNHISSIPSLVLPAHNERMKKERKKTCWEGRSKNGNFRVHEQTTNNKVATILLHFFKTHNDEKQSERLTCWHTLLYLSAPALFVATAGLTWIAIL